MKEMTILKTIQNAVDEVATSLRNNDCCEEVVIHVDKRSALVTLKINNEKYLRHYNLNDGWQKVKEI